MQEYLQIAIVGVVAYCAFNFMNSPTSRLIGHAINGTANAANWFLSSPWTFLLGILLLFLARVVYQSVDTKEIGNRLMNKAKKTPPGTTSVDDRTKAPKKKVKPTEETAARQKFLSGMKSIRERCSEIDEMLRSSQITNNYELDHTKLATLYDKIRAESDPSDTDAQREAHIKKKIDTFVSKNKMQKDGPMPTTKFTDIAMKKAIYELIETTNNTVKISGEFYALNTERTEEQTRLIAESYLMTGQPEEFANEDGEIVKTEEIVAEDGVAIYDETSEAEPPEPSSADDNAAAGEPAGDEVAASDAEPAGAPKVDNGAGVGIGGESRWRAFRTERV